MTARARACLVLVVVAFGAAFAGMQASAKQNRRREPRSGLVIAATPIRPPDGDKYWAFHVINATPGPIESILLEEVSYEWGDEGSSTPAGTRFGPLAPGSSVEIWREINTELRTSVHLVVRGAGGTRRLMAEFPVLDLRKYEDKPSEWRRLVFIPILGRKGLIATELYWKAL